MDLRVGGRFDLGRKIGSGSLGDVYMGTDVQTGTQVAVKLECIKSKNPQLHYESKLYKVLSGGVGIPSMYWYGSEGDFNVMVLELLGPTLEELISFCNRKFSLKTVLMLADQMITRIEYIHNKDYVHADITPENFLIGLGKNAKMVHLIDFGLSKRYRNPSTQRHIEYKDNQSLTGSARYASVNTSMGVHQTRRDDVEALGFVLMYFLRSSLPWQSLKADSKKETFTKILDKKKTTSAETLCEGFPAEFVRWFNYTRSLKFEDRPDYSYLRRMLKDLLIREGYQHDYVYDWIILNYGKEDKDKTAKLPEGEVAEVHVSQLHK